MLIVKAKHGRRRYTYGGRGIISNILKSPLALKLAVAAVTGAVRGIVSRKRQQERERDDQIPSKKQADRVINGTGIILE